MDKAYGCDRCQLTHTHTHTHTHKWFIDQVRSSAESSATALELAERGLSCVYDMFRFEREGAPSLSLSDLQASIEDGTYPLAPAFEAVVVTAAAAPPPAAFELPAWDDDYTSQPALRGADAVEQARRWVQKGVIEPTCLRAVEQAVAGTHQSSLASHTFVVMGANSAMGPFTTLLALGATVVAVDLNRPEVQVCVCACVRERGTERQRDRDRDKVAPSTPFHLFRTTDPLPPPRMRFL